MQTRSAQPPQAFHPARIGPYEVLRRLGAGAMGEVYLARSATSRLVAVKTIRAGLAEHPGYRRRFAHEVDAAKRVSGAFTAAVVGADAHGDLPWLATVYVPAPSLEELVAACGPMEVAAVRWLAAGCAEALECVHRAGLVHRDFKPANVLVTADGPRVIDFGLARSDGLPQGTVAGMVLGTLLYMAPEQANGDPAAGAPADVFALGATLYYAATGNALYQETKAIGPVLQMMREPPDLSAVPEELRGLLGACLALRPSDRPTPAGLIAALSPHLSADQTALPLPAPVLEYIEDYRREQMELLRKPRSRPDADTVVVGQGVDADEAGFPRADGEAAADGAEDGDDDPRPRHPSLLPVRALSPRSRAKSRARAGTRGRARPRRHWATGPAVVAVGVTLALAAAGISALLLVGAVRVGGTDHAQLTDAGPISPGTGSATGPAGPATVAQAPARPASPPPSQAAPPPDGPPPTDSPPPGSNRGSVVPNPPPPQNGDGQGPPPQGPPPGAATEVNGVRLGVRPPFGDPTTTFVLNGHGWPSGAHITVTIVEAPSVPAVETVADGGGDFSVAVNQGAGAVTLADGRYHVRASSSATTETVSFVVGPPLTP
ncbi:serine/threonine-protein kinase [Catenulispora yoronensis]